MIDNRVLRGITEEIFLGDLSNYTDVMRDFEDK